MKLIVENLNSNRIVTRRDIFYNDVDLFHRQEVVDKYIAILSFSLELHSIELGVVASAKGLVLGDLSIVHPNGTETEFSAIMGPQLISTFHKGTTVIIPKTVQYALIVEKDAVFKLLSSSSHPERILITGKGFPDVATREFVELIYLCNKGIPIFCLTDSDIYGLLIYQAYRGSEKMKIIHLGVQLHDYTSGYLDITLREYDMMKRFIEATSGADADRQTRKIYKEAQRGIFLLKKAEMNVVEKGQEIENNNTAPRYEDYIARKIEGEGRFKH